MFYVISPPEEDDWRVTRDDLVAMLKRNWPNADICITDENAPSARDVVWRIQFSDGELEGSQNRAGRVLYLDGPLTGIARFASWWRSHVPNRQALVLYDETYSSHLSLDSGITEQDILARLA